MEWRDISSAPKDGSVIETIRRYQGWEIGPARAVWGSFAADAPMRKWGDGGIYAPIPPDHEFADGQYWMREDRMFRVPEPTHWRPAPNEGNGDEL